MSTGAITAQLDRGPYNFEFFQAVRLLGRLAGDRVTPGGFALP